MSCMLPAVLLFVNDEFYALDNDLSYLLHYEQNF